MPVSFDAHRFSTFAEDTDKIPPGSPCAICKGSKNLCGKDRCPLMVKFYSRAKTKRLINSLDIEGMSPPSVFVGRYGYPKVDIGPLVPPLMGDTSIMDTPELWVGKSIDEFVDFRFSLVRGKHRIDAVNFQKEGRIIEQTRDLALSENPLEVEAAFQKRPTGRLVLDDEVQPFGPSARLKTLEVGNTRYEQHVEKAFYDTDLKATEAVKALYTDGVLVSKIQKAFSVGAFGIDKNRKFVPTRWSITAVDDILGKSLLSNTKYNPLIEDWRIYDWYQLDNRWSILLMPVSWRYELIEAWFPNTVWNPLGKDVEIISSYEFYDGRKKYAEIGGCYYAARLAVNELLQNEGRQAGAVIFREAHPGYIMPVGVWNVRENVRAALKTTPFRFETLNDALNHVASKMSIPIKQWIANSGILKDMFTQRRLDDYV
ncbi:Nre family DNA repair protein [Candidatus Methanomassiliicoccus intestinalis]|uniref:Nre family DNA repair protein n=1 Tax=Candidatus Methanomassiliicoccus intestinalis TaxID=1406512 RepID=UPI0037DD88CA